MEERKRKTDWDFFGPIRRRPIWFRTTTLLFVWPTREIGKSGPDCYHYHPLLLLLILLLLSQMKKKKDFSSKRLRESKFVVSARIVSIIRKTNWLGDWNQLVYSGFLKWANLRPFPVTISTIQIEKSTEGEHGIRIRGHRMVGVDETTEPWLPPTCL